MTKEVAPRKTKEKKRPSDFEIVRTILTRTHERKLPYVLKNMGEDGDILFLCSQNEEGFVYGSSDITIAIFEFTDDELRTTAYNLLSKIYGLNKDSEHQLVVNLRDQISELAKTKGEKFDCEVETNEAGSAWVSRKDVNGRIRIVPFCTAIDSLYHFQTVKEWCKKYRSLLSTEDNSYLYYPYKHPDTDNSSMLKLDRRIEESNHLLASLYPNGFRTIVTRGIDVIIDKSLEEFPYPPIKEELIVVSSTDDNKDPGATAQIVHRLQADGWRMVLVRPNAVFFPTLDTYIPNSESITNVK